MKKNLMLMTLILTFTTQVFAMAKVEGSCKYESTGELITIRPIDPDMHYGLIAEGTSANSKEHVQLDINGSEKINLWIRRENGSASTSTNILSGPTPISLSMEQHGSGWLTCHLVVTL